MIVVEIGYQSLILPREEALALVEILEKSQIYERKYWREEDRKARGMTTDYTYHVYPDEHQYATKIVSDQHYNMAKLAGKPDKD